LKSENILIGTKGNAKFSDVSINPHITNYTRIEILKGQAFNTSSDVWPLGCILHELSMYTVSV
jgi:serine/threonine protein kinase